MLPGAGGAFVGADDELAVVLSNSGRSLSVYDTGKLTSNAAKPLYVAELKEGLMAAVYPGGRQCRARLSRSRGVRCSGRLWRGRQSPAARAE